MEFGFKVFPSILALFSHCGFKAHGLRASVDMIDGSIIPSKSTDDNDDDDHIPPFVIPVCFDCFANEGQIRCDHMVISVCCVWPESKLDGKFSQLVPLFTNRDISLK